MRLGATPLGDATRFEVWAPDASTVEVVIERDGGDLAVELQPESASATWVAVVEGVGAGDRYRYRLDGGEPLPDPASRRQPDGVHGPSAIVDTDSFEWTDDSWTGVELADTVLYELHVGTFTPEGTFAAAVGQLDRLVALGITTIEIMPVAAFPGERNWGYDGVFPSATQESYGGPDGLARLVDAAHGHGLAVVLDVVYNHIGPEGNVLPRFGPYFTDEYSTPWGEAINVAGTHSDSVRRFFIENAVGWIRDFHIDGLRLDAIHAIVDPTARPFVEELTAAVHATADGLGRTVLVTVESSSNDPRIVRSRAAGGWACDAAWNDDYHHAVRVALTGDRHGYYAAYTGAADVAAAWTRRFVYDGRHSITFGRRHGANASDVDHRHFIVFSQNHDHVGNTPRGERMLHVAGPADPRLRLAAASTLLSPFTPMLFMGEEYGERAPFPYFIDHGDPDLVEIVRTGRRDEFSDVDWSGGVADPAAKATFDDAVLDPSLGSTGHHRDLLAWYTELIAIRRSHPVLTDPTAEQVVALDGDVVIVERRLGDATSVLVLNFGDAPHTDARTETGPIIADSSLAQSATVTAWSARLRIDHPGQLVPGTS
ncbi:malto-oligosyltrehalose trehalohydrolase [Ilumatobacter sp.]|uniref:malto-oligosyltrehalose trehalohydrolase n=1 Tax=Ilumatobacter sp. TaxID=1967498 RepID=UPI003C6604B0